jgi:hypothetical protein
MKRAYEYSDSHRSRGPNLAKSTHVDTDPPESPAASTTVRVRRDDKDKLDELCRETNRGVVDMVAHLIKKEYATLFKKRKAC